MNPDVADDFIRGLTFKSGSQLTLLPSAKPLVTFCNFETFLAGK